MIIRDKDKDVIEVEMFHIVNLGKLNAIFNFKQYLNQLLLEFEQELTRRLYQVPTMDEPKLILKNENPIRNDGSSHIIQP